MLDCICFLYFSEVLNFTLNLSDLNKIQKLQFTFIFISLMRRGRTTFKGLNKIKFNDNMQHITLVGFPKGFH